jgi:hypothetical protein
VCCCYYSVLLLVFIGDAPSCGVRCITFGHTHSSNCCFLSVHTSIPLMTVFQSLSAVSTELKTRLGPCHAARCLRQRIELFHGPHIGVPSSPAEWTETLHTAVHLQPKPSHLSVYDLQIEGGTVFGTHDSDRESTFHQTRGELPRYSLASLEEECASCTSTQQDIFVPYAMSTTRLTYALLQDSNRPSPTRSKHTKYTGRQTVNAGVG